MTEAMAFVRERWRKVVDYSIGLNEAIEELRLQDNPVANGLLSAYQTSQYPEYKRNIEHQILESTGRGHLILSNPLQEIMRR